jgi:hypothetical protein
MMVNLLVRKRSLFVAAPMLIGLLLVGLLLVSISTDTILAQAPNGKSAHVVVQYVDGDTAVRPITWTATMTRIGALKAAGFDTAHDGDLVCNIEGEGCPASDCFCPDNWWAQGQWAGTAWDTSAWPPPDLEDGDVIAFRNATGFGDWGLTGFLPGAMTYVAASDALEWMRNQQQNDGSYGDSFGKIGASNRALLALGSAGYDPEEWGTPSLLDFLTVLSRTETMAYAASSASAAGKLAVGAAWTNQTVTDFAGINLPVSITATYSPTTGAYGAGSGDTAWAMLGLHAAGEEIPTETINFLKSVQNDDGGWAWNEWGDTSEIQHTALVVQAFLAAGEPLTGTEVTEALALIDSAENSDGGYGYGLGNMSDVDTTSFVIQALLSAGQNPPANWCATIECRYLLAEQANDGGFLFGGSPSLYATQEAIPALMHRPFGPLAPWTYNCYATYLPLVNRNPASGR